MASSSLLLLPISASKLTTNTNTTRIRRPHSYSTRQIIKCKALDGDTSLNPIVYQGVYGPWTIDSTDIKEVVLYRAGLVTAATTFVTASSTAFLPTNFLFTQLLDKDLDFLYTLGAAGLGLSLSLIHIYVTPLKRTLQAFYVLGVIGSLLTYIQLAQPGGESLVHYVVNNPTAVWFVGPLFAALTGLVFKEGLCYGKLEAGLLTFIIPTLLLGHLFTRNVQSGLMDDGVKHALLGSWMALFVIFAGRKFTQPIKYSDASCLLYKDDIGDKSVFMFMALSENEKEALIEKVRAAQGQSEE
ncbi:hypothetical protein ACFE04_024960 [Oxalis oulophora]